MSSDPRDTGMPIAITLDAGTYFRCTCGRSNNLPFCDESHRGDHLPLRFTLEARQKVYLCACGRSGRQPFCDQRCGTELPED